MVKYDMLELYKGFSLCELVIVIAIISFPTANAYVKYEAITEKLIICV